MNTSLANLSVKQLLRAAAIKTRIEALEKELNKEIGSSATASAQPSQKRRTMSKAAKARISAAAKARWAKIRAAKAGSQGKRRTMSAAARAKISAAAKARWAKIRAAQKK